MKIRNHRNRSWCFYPNDNSNIVNKSAYIYKYKSDLMNFLNSNIEGAVNGLVVLEEKSFNRSGRIRSWFVWCNNYKEDNEKLKVKLIQQDFRGHKFFISKEGRKIDKYSKKYFAFSGKVINLMCSIGDDGFVSKNKAQRLLNLFKKRGFKDWEVNDDDDKRYIEYHIDRGIGFYHWSDRCNWLRTKTVIEYLKRKDLI